MVYHYSGYVSLNEVTRTSLGPHYNGVSVFLRPGWRNSKTLCPMCGGETEGSLSIAPPPRLIDLFERVRERVHVHS